MEANMRARAPAGVGIISHFYSQRGENRKKEVKKKKEEKENDATRKRTKQASNEPCNF